MTARRAGTVVASVGVLLLVVAEFTTVYEVTVGSLEVVTRSRTGGENHGYALLVVAVVAALMALGALRGGTRPPALALVVLGVVALAVALAVDLPDTRGSGGLPESLAYEQARARAGPGLGLEIAGGALLVVAGGMSLYRARSLSGRRSSPPGEARP